MYGIIEFEVLVVNHFRSTCLATSLGASPSRIPRARDFPRPNVLRFLTKGLPFTGLCIAAKGDGATIG